MRKILFLFLTILSVKSIYAQNTEIGFRAGPNLNSIRGNKIVNEFHDPLIGYSAGLQVRFNAHRKLSVFTALHYEQNGSRLNDIDFTDGFGSYLGTGDLLIHLNYLVVPVMARYSTGKNTKLFFSGGPFFGYLLQNKVVKKNTSNSGSSGTAVNTEPPNYKSINLGLSTAIGLHIPLHTNLSVEASFENHLGLAPIDESESTQKNHIKTNSINFYLGLSYKL